MALSWTEAHGQVRRDTDVSKRRASSRRCTGRLLSRSGRRARNRCLRLISSRPVASSCSGCHPPQPDAPPATRPTDPSGGQVTWPLGLLGPAAQVAPWNSGTVERRSQPNRRIMCLARASSRRRSIYDLHPATDQWRNRWPIPFKCHRLCINSSNFLKKISTAIFFFKGKLYFIHFVIF